MRAPRTPARRTFAVVAAVEAVTLLALLVNLATVHLPGVSAALGPVHGSAYLIAIALAFSGPFTPRARALAAVPGIGALLAARTAPTAPNALTAGRRRGDHHGTP